MRPAFNFEIKYRVAMLSTENWTKGTGTPIAKGFVWFTDGSKMKEGTGAKSLWEICEKKPHSFSRKICHSLSGSDICYLAVCL